MRLLVVTSLLLLAVCATSDKGRIQYNQYNTDVPDKLKKYLPLSSINVYNQLSPANKEKLKPAAQEFQETHDKNEFFHKALAVDSKFAKQIINLHQLERLQKIGASNEQEEAKAKVRGEKAFDLGVALISSDPAYLAKAKAAAAASKK